MRMLLRARRGWMVVLGGYAACAAAIAGGRLAIAEPSGKVWDVRVANIWRMAEAAVDRNAPGFHVVFLAAVFCVVALAPITVWSLARVAEPAPPALPREWETEHQADWNSATLPAALWMAIVLALMIGAALAVTPVAAVGEHALSLSRADSLRGSLAAGEWLRWVPDHQGGYPTEARPDGVAWLALAAWTLTPGAASMVDAYPAVLAIVLLAPVLLFVQCGRNDRWPIGVAATAAVLHLGIAGGPGAGGYRTLVEGGPVNESLAAAGLLALIAALPRVRRSRTTAAAAAVLGAATVASSQAAWLPVVLACLIGLARSNHLWPVAALIAALLTPLWLPLVATAADYAVFQAPGYFSTDAVVRAVADAVGVPVFVLALVGAVASIVLAERPMARLATLALAAMLGVAAFGCVTNGCALPFVDASRLVPFCRVLLLFLAGVGAHVLVRLAAVAYGTSPAWSERVHVAGLAVAALLLTVPSPLLRAEATGFRTPHGFTRSATEDLARTLQAVRDLQHDGAVLVLGKAPGAAPIQAPVLQPGPYFYDDPLWHWDRAAPPTYERVWDGRLHMAVPQLLASSFLEARGISALVVSGRARALVAGEPRRFRPLAAGVLFDAYAVRQPRSMVWWPGTVTSTDRTPHVVRASGVATGAEAYVAVNWHPRWRAFVNGEAVAARSTAEGTTRVAISPGPIAFTLAYASTWTDSVALAAPIAALFTALMWVVPHRRRTRGAHAAP